MKTKYSKTGSEISKKDIFLYRGEVWAVITEFNTDQFCGEEFGYGGHFHAFNLNTHEVSVFDCAEYYDVLEQDGVLNFKDKK